MKNYLDEIYTVSEFQHDHPALAEKAERALNYLKLPLYARRNDRLFR